MPMLLLLPPVFVAPLALFRSHFTKISDSEN